MLATCFTSIKRLDKVDWTVKTDIRSFWYPALFLSGCQAKANHLFCCVLCFKFGLKQVSSLANLSQLFAIVVKVVSLQTLLGCYVMVVLT